MFFQVTAPRSSNIEVLCVNPATSECIVEYKSGGVYSYTNVDKVAIDDLLYVRGDISLGQWVNANLAKNSGVICDNLDEVIRNIQREDYIDLNELAQVARAAWFLFLFMSYSELIPNFNMWEDAVNDVHEHSKPDCFGDSHQSRFNNYFYCYLDCIHSFDNSEHF